MLEINLVCVGKIKEDYFKDAINEYIKRLSSYSKVNIIEVDEFKASKNPSDKEIEIIKEEEGKNILKQIPQNKILITLDLNKKQRNSVEFASFLSSNIDKSNSKLFFAIGGSYGLGENVKSRANDTITLSEMTFTHQMTRIIILEQLYRAFKILHNEVYHK